LLYILFPNRQRLYRAVQWMGKDINDDFLQLIEAIFHHVRVEADMPSPAIKAELTNFKAPTLIIAAEKDVMFPGKAVINRAKEIIPNLIVAECLKDGTHLSSTSDLKYINKRLMEFLEKTP